MKILLHIGQGKTGTTALQRSLNGAAEMLRSRKVIYPQFGDGFENHELLMALVGKPERIFPSTLARLGGPEGAVRVAKAAWDATCEDVRRSRPEVLVLSSEYLVGSDGATKARLGAFLSELSSDITPIIYVRHPVDFYRACLQQQLKSNDRSFPPRSPNLKMSILESEVAFSQRPELVAFDRKTLHGGDIIEDFATRFLAPWVTAAELPRFQSNVGLSAEALVLMARLRAEAGGSYEASRSVARLVPRLAALDRKDPSPQSFTLLPEVAEAALRSATSYRWLAETGQLEIPGLDIGSIDGAPVPGWMSAAAPETLFLHDPDRLDRLRRAIQDRKPKGKAAAQSHSRPVKPSADPKPRLRDLLLRFLQQKLASAQGRNTGDAPTGNVSSRPSLQGKRDEDI